MLLLVLAIVAAIFAFALIAAQVSSGDTQSFDEAILTSMRQAGDPSLTIGPRWLEGTALELTALGSAGVLIAVVTAVAGYLTIERRFGLLLMTAYMKEIFGRQRPTVVPHLQQVSSPSFPSGHAMLSAVVYLTLGVMLARSTKDRKLRVYFVVTAIILTFIVGLTRMFLGVHYPTDVLGGWVAGTFWALLIAVIERALERRGVDPTVPAPPDALTATKPPSADASRDPTDL
jgi:undecaprenyl-diphosphatase